MSLTLNMVGGGSGGGISPNAAIIHVTAPVGSTISFSKGGVVAKVLPPEKSHISASDATMAEWYYSVGSSNYGAWDITASLDWDSISGSVTVSSNKQYDIKLKYNKWLFKEGIGEIVAFSQFADVSGLISVTEDYIRIVGGSGSVGYYATQSIDLANYSKYYVEASISYQSGDSSWAGCANIKSSLGGQTIKPGENRVASATFTANSTRQIYSINLASITGSSYCGVGGNIGGDIFNMWLE